MQASEGEIKVVVWGAGPLAWWRTRSLAGARWQSGTLDAGIVLARGRLRVSPGHELDASVSSFPPLPGLHHCRMSLAGVDDEAVSLPVVPGLRAMAGQFANTATVAVDGPGIVAVPRAWRRSPLAPRFLRPWSDLGWSFACHDDYFRTYLRASTRLVTGDAGYVRVEEGESVAVLPADPTAAIAARLAPNVLETLLVHGPGELAAAWRREELGEVGWIVRQRIEGLLLAALSANQTDAEVGGAAGPVFVASRDERSVRYAPLAHVRVLVELPPVPGPEEFWRSMEAPATGADDRRPQLRPWNALRTVLVDSSDVRKLRAWLTDGRVPFTHLELPRIQPLLGRGVALDVFAAASLEASRTQPPAVASAPPSSLGAPLPTPAPHAAPPSSSTAAPPSTAAAPPPSSTAAPPSSSTVAAPAPPAQPAAVPAAPLLLPPAATPAPPAATPAPAAGLGLGSLATGRGPGGERPPADLVALGRRPAEPPAKPAGSGVPRTEPDALRDWPAPPEPPGRRRRGVMDRVLDLFRPGEEDATDDASAAPSAAPPPPAVPPRPEPTTGPVPPRPPPAGVTEPPPETTELPALRADDDAEAEPEDRTLDGSDEPIRYDPVRVAIAVPHRPDTVRLVAERDGHPFDGLTLRPSPEYVPNGAAYEVIGGPPPIDAVLRVEFEPQDVDAESEA